MESHSDSQTKANIVNDRFTSVFTAEPEASLPDLGDNHNPALPTITVTEPGVAKLLCRINVHEATGPDKIPAHLLKEISIQLSSAYTLLFQTSVTQGEIPVDWCHGFVTPLFKKGDRSKAENYRPISLTSITSKLLEHIIYRAMMDHLERLNILNDALHGFHKRRSTETQLILTIQDLAKGLDDGGQIDTLLLDFSKAAFICRLLLIRPLIRSHINTYNTYWITMGSEDPLSAGSRASFETEPNKSCARQPLATC